jgi:hypothetical protein
MNKEQINKALEYACKEYTAYLSRNNKPVHCPAQEYVEPKNNMKETLETLLDNLGLKWWKKELQNKLLYQNTRYDLIVLELIGKQLVNEDNPILKWNKYSKIYINVIKTITIPTPLWIVNEDWMALARKFKIIFRSCGGGRQPYEIPPFGFLDYFDSCENVKPNSLLRAISFILDKSTDFSDAELFIYRYTYNRNFITGVGGDGTHRIYASVLLAPLIERIRMSISVIEIDGLKLTEFLKQLSTDGTTQP